MASQLALATFQQMPAASALSPHIRAVVLQAIDYNILPVLTNCKELLVNLQGSFAVDDPIRVEIEGMIHDLDEAMKSS